MRIRQKLLLVFLCIGIVPIVGVGILSFRHTANALRQNALTKLEVVTELKVKRLEFFIDAVGADLQIAQDYYNIEAHFPALIAFAHDRTQPEYLSATAALNRQLRTFTRVKQYMDVVLADPHGRIVYRSAIGRSDLELDNFLQDIDLAKFQDSERGFYIAQIFPHKSVNNTFYMLATTQVKDDAGAIAGFLAFQIPMKTISTFIEDSTGLGETGETLLGAAAGEEVLFLTPLRHLRDSTLKHRVRFGDVRALPMQAAARGETDSGISVDYRAEKVLAAWRHIPSANWGMVTKTDAKEAFAPVRALQIAFLIISLIVLGVVVAMAFWFAQTISRPVRALQKGAEIERTVSERTRRTRSASSPAPSTIWWGRCGRNRPSWKNPIKSCRTCSM